MLKALVICLSVLLVLILPVSLRIGKHVAAGPDVWTDGSLVEDKVSGASSSGSGFFTGRTGLLCTDRWWGHLDDDDG